MSTRKRKYVVALCFTLALAGMTIGASSVSAASADGELAVSPTEITLEEGDSAEIAVTYERLSDATPQGIEYTLTYDPAVISVIEQEQRPYLGGNEFVNNVSTPGEVEYLEARLDDERVETPEGTVATITVEPASDVDDGATTNLNFTTAGASEGDTTFTITTTNGTIEAESAAETDDSTTDDSQLSGPTDDESDADDSDTNDQLDDSPADDHDSVTGDDSTTETEETDTEPTDDREPPADDASDDDTLPESDTDDSVPGFGMTITILSILMTTYIIRQRTC